MIVIVVPICWLAGPRTHPLVHKHPHVEIYKASVDLSSWGRIVAGWDTIGSGKKWTKERGFRNCLGSA